VALSAHTGVESVVFVILLVVANTHKVIDESAASFL